MLEGGDAFVSTGERAWLAWPEETSQTHKPRWQSSCYGSVFLGSKVWPRPRLHCIGIRGRGGLHHPAPLPHVATSMASEIGGHDQGVDVIKIVRVQKVESMGRRQGRKDWPQEV